MNDAEVKEKIRNAIQSFNKRDLTTASLELFNILTYNTGRQAPLDKPSREAFKESFVGPDSKFSEEKALFEDWKYVDLLFQLSDQEMKKQTSLFVSKQVDRTIIESYIFFIIELSRDQYNRTDLIRLTREVNSIFKMPAMLVFKHLALGTPLTN